MIFQSPYKQFARYNGQKCVFLGLTSSQAKDAEVGHLFRVRFEDGNEIEVWPEELEQTEVNPMDPILAASSEDTPDTLLDPVVNRLAMDAAEHANTNGFDSQVEFISYHLGPEIAKTIVEQAIERVRDANRPKQLIQELASIVGKMIAENWTKQRIAEALDQTLQEEETP